MVKTVHKSVLLHETIDGLGLKGECLVLDATFGGGGHSLQVLTEYPKASIVALDQDKAAWDKAKDKFNNMKDRIHFVNSNFRNIGKEIFESGEAREVDGIIFDLGLSSDQLENSGRGFSFMKSEPLLMTMKEDLLPEDLTAGYIVNNFEEKNLADIIYGYGEERYSRRIAKAIVEAREKNEIKTTEELSNIIRDAVPAAYKRGRTNPATKTFQALRIATNDELGALSEGLKNSFRILKKGGRMSVISFHSLEDRIVKRYFKSLAEEKKVILINKKPIIPSEDEIKGNPRSRSSKLRIIEKI